MLIIRWMALFTSCNPHLIDSILKDLHLNGPDRKPEVTPGPVTVPLQIFESGAQPFDKQFHYHLVIGKLNFLGQSRPDCVYAIHQCA